METKERLEQLFESMKDLYARKNKDYGNSFTKNFKEYGITSSLIRLDDKVNRLLRLMKGNKQNVADESMRDTLVDLTSYSFMTIVELFYDTENALDMTVFYNEVLDNFINKSNFFEENIQGAFSIAYETTGMGWVAAILAQDIFILKGHVKEGKTMAVLIPDLLHIVSIALFVILLIDKETEEVEDSDIKMATEN